jgi:hypothetical protein
MQHLLIDLAFLSLPSMLLDVLIFLTYFVLRTTDHTKDAILDNLCIAKPIGLLIVKCLTFIGLLGSPDYGDWLSHELRVQIGLSGGIEWLLVLWVQDWR